MSLLVFRQAEKLQNQVEVLQALVDMVGGSQKQAGANGKVAKARQTTGVRTFRGKDHLPQLANP